MIPLAKAIDRITGPFREFGVGAGLLYAIDRVLCRLSPRARLHVYEWMVQPIGDKPLLPRRLTRIEVREIPLDDPAIDRMPVRPEVMQARRAQRATCLGAFENESLVGYMWFCQPTYEEDEVRCTYVLADGERSVFDFDFYLYPQYRMGTGFVALWNGANQLLHGRGIRYTFSRLTRFNVASRRAHRHLGWKTAGRAVFLQLRTFELMLATCSPYVRSTVGGRIRVILRPDVLEAP